MTDPGILLFKEAMTCLQHKTKPAEDFQRRSLDLMMKRLSTYRCRVLPSAPQEVQAYHQESKDKQWQLDKDGFWRNSSQAYAWLMECDRIAGMNRGHHGLLKDALLLPCLTLEEKTAILKVMAEFTDFYKKDCERAGYRPLIKEEQQEETEDVVLDTEALDAVSMFGGEVIQ